MQKAERKAQINARCQIRADLFKKDGRRAQISSVGLKLLYEIHPRLKLVLTSLVTFSGEHWSASC
jgi:hypothetical protein